MSSFWRFFLATGLLIAACAGALGNGSASETGVPGTGNAASLETKHTTNVSIKDEKLTINLHQEFAEVEVRYEMVNSGSKVMQGFYFPIERWLTDLTDYHIAVDGKEIPWTGIGGPASHKETDASDPMDGPDRPIKAWKKSMIPFSSRQTREVVIRYDAAYAQYESAISDDVDEDDAFFAYSLSPAATWKGPIRKGVVTINVLHPEPGDVSISKPRNRFAKVTETQYVWNFQDLTPTLDDDIKIVAHSGYKSYPANGYNESSAMHGEYIIQGNHYYFLHTDYEATASSTLKPEGEIHYDVSNIGKQYDQGSAWATPSGVGATITLDVKRQLPLDAILITPGYKSDNQALWSENCRVAQIEVTLNGEYTFEAAIPDEKFNDPYPIVVKGYSKPVKKVQLLIKSVYPGTKFKDTCISLVELRARLSKKPEIQPAR